MTDPALVSSGHLPLLLIVSAVCALLLGVAATLWAWYGSTVFFEMIAAGLAYCF